MCQSEIPNLSPLAREYLLRIDAGEELVWSRRGGHLCYEIGGVEVERPDELDKLFQAKLIDRVPLPSGDHAVKQPISEKGRELAHRLRASAPPARS